jgi:uncharacterized protein DUF3857
VGVARQSNPEVPDMIHRHIDVVMRLMFVLLLGLVLPHPLRGGDEWLPVTAEELRMTREPAAPGAPAIYLYRQVDRDDTTFHETNYARIKILTEEGRKYADIEIPFIKGRGNIHSIKARTVGPDGKITNFDGKIFEKTVVKARGVKFLAKTFTLPDVQVGSIIEYHYTFDWEYYIYDSRWILSEELFTKHAKFSLKQNEHFGISWSWPVGLPAGTAPPRGDRNMIRLETHDVPAFHIEDYMPPENALKYRVDFVYSEENVEKDVDKFWIEQGKKQNGKVESFVGKRKAMEQAVAQMLYPNDPPEAKLQKIYARVQQVRNLSFELEKTEEEKKREKIKDVSNVEEVLKRGYGDGREITWLFLGLARAAGFEAYPVLVSRRDRYFFNRNLKNPNELNDNVVLVKLNGKDLYFDPGTEYTQYGLLPWPETAVQGLKLDKEGGGWVQTPLPGSATSRIARKAALKLTSDGALEGKLTVTFTGLEALERRMEERNQDEATRKKFLEDQIKEYIPTGIEVDLTNKPDWESAAPVLVAEYDLKIPGWVSGAGRRALLPVALFGNTEKHVFEHSDRVHPVYFQFPFEKYDDITIELPIGWKVSSLPPAQDQDAKAIQYTIKVEDQKGTLHVTRKVRVDLFMVAKEKYPILRSFFQAVRTGDEQQIVLQPGT